MKFPISWLDDHLRDPPDIDTLARVLTDLGLEVENVLHPDPALEPLLAGEIVRVEKHPNADRLSICHVECRGLHRIVCGAPNVAIGAIAVFAPVGTTLPHSDITIEERAIRGITSAGMLCSAKEIGLGGDGAGYGAGNKGEDEKDGGEDEKDEGKDEGKDEDGILLLPKDTVPGTPLVDVLGLRDPVIDISLTPNRGDCAGMRGIARDLAAAGYGTLKPLSLKLLSLKDSPLKAAALKSAPQITRGSQTDCPATDYPATDRPATDCPVTLESALRDDAKDACPFFAGRMITGVKNRPSPPWLIQRLRACGIKPISALVDITNYFTIDRCRPLHVFDGDRIGTKLILRTTRQGEKMHALDRQEYDLPEGVTVIANDHSILALGGLIGGMDSGVRDDTVHVFLESAWFDPDRTARSGRALGIESDARYRFERSVDPLSTLPELDAATRMIIDWCGGQASAPVIHGEAPPPPPPVSLSMEKLRTFGGTDIRPAQARKILRHLGFRDSSGADSSGADSSKAGSSTWNVPSWRRDIAGEQDMIGEVMRIHGYASIRSEPMTGDPVTPTREHKKPGAIAASLAAAGLFETIGWSFLDPADITSFGFHNAPRITNPISAALAVLRPCLMPHLIQAARRNQHHGQKKIRLFEIGPVWPKEDKGRPDSGRPDSEPPKEHADTLHPKERQDKDQADKGRPQQVTRVGWLRSGIMQPRRWNRAERRVEIFDIKADLFSLGEDLDIPLADWRITPLVTLSGAKLSGADRSGADHSGVGHAGLDQARSAQVSRRDKTSGKWIDVGVIGALDDTCRQHFDCPEDMFIAELDIDALPVARSDQRPAPTLSPFLPIERDFAFILERDLPIGTLIQAIRDVDPTHIQDVTMFDLYQGDRIEAGKKSVAITIRIESFAKTLREKDIRSVCDAVIKTAAALGAVLRRRE